MGYSTNGRVSVRSRSKCRAEARHAPFLGTAESRSDQCCAAMGARCNISYRVRLGVTPRRDACVLSAQDASFVSRRLPFVESEFWIALANETYGTALDLPQARGLP